jgi:hypothetical protein
MQQWPDHPGTVGIVVAFAVECAWDKVMFVFAADGVGERVRET